MIHKIAAIGTMAIAIGLASVGCNSGNNAPAQPAGPAGPAWKLTLNSKCPSGDPQLCTAAYGFTVTANGDFIVGPGPKGQISTGQLSSDEFKSLSTLVKSLKADTGETCIQADPLATDETLVLTQNKNQHTILHQANTDLCYRANTADGARDLHQAMAELADRYYPAPFPDDCLDAAAAFEAKYPAMQKCTGDADCAYLDDSFDPISPGSAQYVTTDGCSKLKPLPVGNIAAVVNHQNELLQGLDNVRTVCGQRLIRPDCSQFVGFQSTDAPPVCRAGVCKINPSLAH